MIKVFSAQSKLWLGVPIMNAYLQQEEGKGIRSFACTISRRVMRFNTLSDAILQLLKSHGERQNLGQHVNKELKM
jgi:hypothetical protein